MNNPTLTIETLPMNTLKPADYNPRIMEEDVLTKLCRSIEEFGFIDPVIINHDNTIIGGHQRYLAAEKLGLTNVPCVRLNLDPKRAKVLNIALNKIHGTWDDVKLTQLLNEFHHDSQIDEVLSGFNSADIDKLLADLPSAENTNDPDDIPAIAEETNSRVQLGQVWTLGPHRLLCGDAMNETHRATLLGTRTINMVFTDPPYNVAYDGGPKPAKEIKRDIHNDNMNPAAWTEFCQTLASTLKSTCPEGDIYCWMEGRAKGLSIADALHKSGCHWSSTLIWKKHHFVLSRGNYHHEYEPCYYGWFSKSSYQGDRTQSDVWEHDRPTRSTDHPMMKPIDLCRRAIRNSSHRGATVLDLFAGSGSTLIACEHENRINLSMELNPIYADVIIRRWETMTGLEAKRCE